MADTRSPRQAGFTLLEVLIVLVLLGLLMTALAEGVRFGLNAWTLQTRASERITALEATDRSLRLLIENMRPVAVGAPQRLIAGHPDSLTFVTTMPAVLASDRGALMTLLVTRDHRLVLRWRPHRHELARDDASKEAEILLLPEVKTLSLAYWRESMSGIGGGWVNDWDQPRLPGLVRIHLDFPPGDPRHWPDMVIATAVEPWTN